MGKNIEPKVDIQLLSIVGCFPESPLGSYLTEITRGIWGLTTEDKIEMEKMVGLTAAKAQNLANPIPACKDPSQWLCPSAEPNQSRQGTLLAVLLDLGPELTGFAGC